MSMTNLTIMEEARSIAGGQLRFFREMRASRSIKAPLEAFPHIIDLMTALWGHPEFCAYMRKLTVQERDKTRNGFSTEVFSDIMAVYMLHKTLFGPENDLDSTPFTF